MLKVLETSLFVECQKYKLLKIINLPFIKINFGCILEA